jgi:transcriptional regulator with XRE-family HTH domain
VKSNPDPIDVHVGGRVRLRRMLIGMSQEKLGTALGLTFQQIQKYERGANRIGSSRLFRISQFLDVPVSFFFDDMSGVVGGGGGLREAGQTRFEADYFGRRESQELLRNYYRIGDTTVRKRLLSLVKAVAASESAGDSAEG